MAKQRVGYFEDREDPEAQCSRCRLCELICAFHHHQVGNPRRAKIKVIALGKVVDVRGGIAAAKLSQILKGLNDEKAYNYAEFGIGLNPKARLAATNLEDLSRLGNCHAGIGSNFAIGGNVLAPNHIDAMYRDAVVYFDGKVVLDNGVCKI